MSEPADIFLWANNTEGIRDSLEIDLFLVNKNYTVYSIGYSQDILVQMKDLFLIGMLKDVNLGAGLGMSVRNFEDAEAEDNVIQRTELQYVQHASEVLHQIETEEADIEPFSEENHEFKRIKAIIARFTKPGAKPFYIVKLIQQSRVLKGSNAWSLASDSFRSFEADAGLNIQPDSQVLVFDDYIFALNQPKFEKIFADAKVREIEANFKLSFAEGQSLNSLIKGKKRLINKLQKVEPSSVKQEDVENHAEEMGLEMMNDDSGAIIIMDEKDLDQFITLLNDDYMTSELTGKKYKIGSKKPLE
jgi:hypothetical protein